MRIICQIVPALPPVTNGLGDYAINLARQLRKEHHINTSFIVGNPMWAGPSVVEGFPVIKITHTSPGDLVKIMDSAQNGISAILLHYVNYAYARRGCPYWLLEGLKKWKSDSPDRILITMFHELYASGPLWSSAFWLGPVQKSIAAGLAITSDHCMTSKELYSGIIKKLSGGKHLCVPALPVFSNTGEPPRALLLERRNPVMVVFGLVANRRLVYAGALTELYKSCKHMGIREVLDIGPELGMDIPRMDDIAIIKLGMLAERRVSEIMATAMAGFLNYDPYYLGKSGIFAAYCAHGLLPINATFAKGAVDGLIAGEHYWAANDHSEFDLPRAQKIADNAHRWYQTHDLETHAKALVSILQSTDRNVSTGWA